MNPFNCIEKKSHKRCLRVLAPRPQGWPNLTNVDLDSKITLICNIRDLAESQPQLRRFNGELYLYFDSIQTAWCGPGTVMRPSGEVEWPFLTLQFGYKSTKESSGDTQRDFHNVTLAKDTIPTIFRNSQLVQGSALSSIGQAWFSR